MRKRADSEKRQQDHAEKTMVTIEATAARQFEEDRKAEEEHRAASLGHWVSQSGVAVYSYSTEKATAPSATDSHGGQGQPLQGG